MYYLTDTNTDKLVGSDGKTMVDICAEALAFFTYGEASEASQNYGDNINVTGGF